MAMRPFAKLRWILVSYIASYPVTFQDFEHRGVNCELCTNPQGSFSISSLRSLLTVGVWSQNREC